MPEMRISLCGRRIILASQLMAHDALAAHATYELGISENFRARSIQALPALLLGQPCLYWSLLWSRRGR
jgi:hypothetical protein